MRHLADLVLDPKTGAVVGNTKLKALCGATGKSVLPKGTPTSEGVCPRCLALSKNES
jgi:hypothetical protein